MSKLQDNHVATLINLGADAMSNMYDVRITLPEDIQNIYQSLSDELVLRAKGFTPPKFNVKTYKVPYKTIEIDRPATKIEGERSFEIEFRLDASYKVYEMLKLWKARTGTGSTGYASNAIYGTGYGNNNSLGTVTINSLATSIKMNGTGEDAYFADGVNTDFFTENGSQRTLQWKFHQCWLQDLDEPAFNMENADPISIKAKFFFGNYEDPLYKEWRDQV
jgi:hypothetical protein